METRKYCPFNTGETKCNECCKLYKEEEKRCVFQLIARNLEKLNTNMRE